MTMESDITSALPEGLGQLVKAQLARTGARIARLDWQGRTFWLKRPEVRSLRWRLQKGDPARSFAVELAAMERLRAAGAPVPQVLAEGRDFLLVADAGRPIADLLDDPAVPDAEVLRALQAAAETLAGLHRQRLAHGRPYLRDLCWDGRTLTLIDLERSRPRAGALRQGADVVLFLASLLAHPRGALLAPAIAPVLRAVPRAWAAAGFWVTMLRLLTPIARLSRIRRRAGPEIDGYLVLVERWPELGRVA
jgi:tRNA A-37 threonylcarbamoyl transferase component Bud32